MSDEAIKLFRGIMAATANGIKTCTLGKIVRFDVQKMKADIQPLVRHRNKDGTTAEPSLLVEVPVAYIKTKDFMIRTPYAEGDIVLVVFADTDIDNVLLTGSMADPNSERTHSLDDAIAIGGITPYSESTPAEHSEDLLISTTDLETKIVLTKTGDIEIKAKNITLDAAQNINIKEAGQEVQVGSQNVLVGD